MVAGFSLLAGSCASLPQVPPSGLAGLSRIAEVDPRFQSYNVEMVEVTGGRFWAPYGGPKGEVYRMREPIDLGDQRLRQLAAQLAPAYMRVSGTWANTTYLPATGEEASEPPKGFRQVLTREQWRGVVEFSQSLDAPIVTSFAVSEGTRDANDVWTPQQAQRLLDLTREAGGAIHAAEFFNEPNVPAISGLPKGYSAAAYGRDFRVFHDWARIAAPDMLILGPGGLGDATFPPGFAEQAAAATGMIGTDAMLAANPAKLDGVSWHFYGGVSQRCGTFGMPVAQRDGALSWEWLDRTMLDEARIAALRDQYEPGRPLWLTETAQAACGGSPWAAGFADSFRYLNQLGLLAQRGVKVVMHNTLAASDYALIDGDTLEPRPNYWAAVLWRRTMGPVVLAPPPAPDLSVRLYAHCLPEMDGGVGLLALNLGTVPQVIALPAKGDAWLMQANDLDAGPATVNGREPVLAADGRLTGLDPMPFANRLDLPATSIAFLAISSVGNPACHR
ncbi:MAG: hypothetical protein H6918_01675 [Sphingomonadaceae bacterium]|nr:hypothetical protein [Sphingomonadaceae bacterium]